MKIWFRIPQLLSLLCAIFWFVGSARAQSEQFTRVVEGALVHDGGWSFGASWMDYDGDSFLDLLVTNFNMSNPGAGPNFLYHGNGDGSFERVLTGPLADDAGCLTSTWADCDNDGDADAYVCGAGTANHFYLNNGDGTLSEMTAVPPVTTGHHSMGAMWVDYDRDSRLDLFVVNHRPPGTPAVENELYHNEPGAFVLMNNAAIGLIADEGNGAAWGDIDGDNDLDLYVSRNDNTSLLYANDGDGTFTLLSSNMVSNEGTHQGNFADYDNDGDLDLYACIDYPGNVTLYQNDGSGNFTDVTAQAIGDDPGYWSGGYWADCDNDGDLDLFVTAHYYYQSRPNRLYINDGDGTFSIATTGAVATDSEASSRGVWGDIERDGDLDLFVANANNQNNTLYLNSGNSNHWIEITCVGTVSNRSAIGAKVCLKAHIFGQDVWQLREISSQSGFLGQDQMTAHFGLGDAGVIDSLKLEWPSGIVQVMENVPVDQFLTVTERCCSGRVGDANGEGDFPDEVTLGDVMLLVDVKFVSGDCSKIPCLAEADVNQDGGSNPNCDDHVTLGDIMSLVDFLFISGPENGTLPACLGGSDVFSIPSGGGVTVDGQLQPSEWADANSVTLSIDGTVETTIMAKHDGINLLLACIHSFLGEAGLCFPEVFLDTDNDKSPEWQTDDWWFHVSGSDCEARGTYGVYSDCSVIQSDWQAEPNFAMTPTPPPLDTFEISIPFSKIGVSVGSTLGLTFRVEWVPSEFGYWPVSASPDAPATWGTALISE